MQMQDDGSRRRTSDFLAGGGEMGGLMRAFDWASTSLGAPAAWPGPLKTAIRLILNTGHPMYVWWGPDLLCFYNDAYSRTLGPERHPGSLGCPGREVWAEIWPQIGHQVDFVMQGRGSTWDENRLVGSTRFGRLDDIYWTYSYSPIDDETAENGVGGVLVVCSETTQSVLAERRQSFRLSLEDRLREVADPGEIVAAAAEAIGRHMGVDQVVYGEIEPGGETVRIDRPWMSATTTAGDARRQRLDDYSPALIADLRDGRRIAIDDILLDPRTSSPDGLPVFLRASVRALLCVPVVKDGRFVAALAIHSARPRLWSQDEVVLAEEIGDRIWSATERARAEEALRHREELQRLIFESALDYAIFTTDDEGIVTSWPAGAETVFGWTESEMVGQDSAITFTGEDRANGEPAKERDTARRDGVAPNVRWHLRKDGRRIFIEGSMRPLREQRDGGRSGYIKIGQDVTARRESEQRQQVLVAELQHRTRNLMGVVLAMAGRTAAGAGSLEEFLPRYRERLGTLARTNDLLSRLEHAERVTFDEVLRTELKARGFLDGEAKGRVVLEGPADVALRSAAVQIFALAIHELATNAVKHGALSDAGGSLRVVWTVQDEGTGPRRLQLDWIESLVEGTFRDDAPPPRFGYGRMLIEKALPYQLQAETTFQLRPGGLTCRIDLPLS